MSLVIALALVLAVFGAAPTEAQAPAPQRLGPETPVGDPVLGPTDANLYAPMIAAGEDGYLAVWEDERQCCDNLIFGTRLDADGNLLDPVGFPISDGGYESDATVVWDGSNYLVVWEDSGIQAVRVTSDGQLLDEKPITVARERENVGVFEPSAATTGNGSFVTWTECHYVPDRCTVDLFGASVSPDGQVGERMALTTNDPGPQSASVMAGGPEGYLLTWFNRRDDVEFMTLDATGASTSSPVIVPKSNTPHPEYANGIFLLVWNGVVDEKNGVWARRVTPAGELLDESPLLVTAPEEGAAVLDVAADPEGGWSVVWSTGRKPQLFASRVGPDGTVANAGSEPLIDDPGEEQDAALAWLGGRATLVWYAPGLLDRIFAVSSDGLDGLSGAEPVLLSQSSNTQYDPAVAWNGEMFLVVWTDLRGDRQEEGIYATRVTPTGQVLDGAGKHLVTPEWMDDARDRVQRRGFPVGVGVRPQRLGTGHICNAGQLRG